METEIEIFTSMEQFMKCFLPKTLKEDEKMLEEDRKRRSIWVEKENE